MELRPDASHKENVPPRPVTPLRLEHRRLQKSLGVGLSSRRDRWVPVGQAERGGPLATQSLGAALHQEPCRVQSNLTSPSPSPSLGLTLRNTTGHLTNSSFCQQSNLQPLAGRLQGRAQEFAIQQSNLSVGETRMAECGRRPSPYLWSEPQEIFWPNMIPGGSPLPRGPLVHPSSSPRRSRLLATGTPSPDVGPAAGLAPLDGHTWPGSRSRCGLGGWTSRLLEEPLTLEDLAVPAQSRAHAPSRAAVHQLLASVQRLGHEAVGLRCRATPEAPGPVQWEPWTRAGQILPARLQPSQPVLASWDERRKHSQGLRETTGFPETPGVQDGLSDIQASSKPASLETTLETLPGDALDPEQRVLPAQPLWRGETCSPGTTYSRGQRKDPLLPQGAGSREARLCSSVSSSSAWGVLPGQEGGDRTPREQVSGEEARPASCLPDTAPVRSALQNKARNTVSLESEIGRRQWRSRCFRAWRHWVQRQRAVAAAVALGRRQLLRRALRALRWTLWLQEAQLEAAWGRHTQALVTRTFQKWRNLIQQQKQGQPHVQAGPGPPPSGGGQDRGPSGRKLVVDTAWRSSPGSPREEAGAQPIPLHSGPRPDEGHRGVQTLQLLQQLAVYLLWGHQKEWARQEKGVQGEAFQARLRTQRIGRPPQAGCSPAADAAWVAPLDTQRQRAWLCRCFGAWQRFMQRGTLYREHVSNCRARTLRLCLQQWVQMKHLRASDGAKVTQLSLCWRKAGNRALPCSAPGGATAHGLGVVAQALPQDQGRGSLQEACRRLALHRALLLWRTRLSQRQRAGSFSEGVRRRALRRILRGWHLRAQDPGSARIASAPGSPGSILGGEAPPGQSTPRSSLGKASRAPALLETLRVGFLWAAGQRQQGRCLLLWQARAQQSRGAARWHQRTLQRRILLGWSHWATAQGARRELGARWAWDRSCRAALGLWRWRLVQRQQAEQWAREWGQRLQRRALGHWHCCWQRQQLLREKYQQWVQVRLQAQRRAVFRGWQQAASRRRPTVASPEPLPLQSHFQARCGVVGDTEMPQAKRPAFQDGLRRRTSGAAFASEAPAAAARPQEQHVAWASFSCWRSREQRRWADRQSRRAWAQQDFIARQVAPGQRCEAHQQAGERTRARARCWTLWERESCLHRVSRDHAVRKLSARVLEAWAQSVTRGRVQRTAITQFQQAGPGCLLRTHWAQWRTVLLSVWLEPQAEDQEAGTAHPRPRTGLRRLPRLATRGRLLVLMNAPALGRQTRSCRPQATGPSLPGPTQHYNPGVQRKWRERSWAQSDREPPLCPAAQLRLQGPRCDCWVQGQHRTGPGGDCSSEIRDLESKGKAEKRSLGRTYLQRWRLEALLRRLQGSQQARRLAAVWQRWVDAQGAEQLARTLLRQWHLRRAWRLWRQRVLRLQVAQRLRQQEDAWVLAQAFERWHRRLAARGQGRGAGPAAAGGPGAGGKLPEPLRLADLGPEQGAQLQLTHAFGKENRSEPHPPGECRLRPQGTQAKSSDGQ